MFTLYTQEEVLDGYIASVEREAAIETIVELSKEFGYSREKAIQIISKKLNLSLYLAKEMSEKYWQDDPGKDS